MSVRPAGRGAGVLMAWLIALLALLLVGSTLQAARSRDAAAAESSPVVIDAVYADSYELNDADEAIGLRNVTTAPVNIGGWYLTDGGDDTGGHSARHDHPAGCPVLDHARQGRLRAAVCQPG